MRFRTAAMTALFAAVSFLAATGGASAQQRRTLTLDESIQLGLGNSRQLHSSTMAVHAADAKVGEINAARLPSLKFAGGYTRLSDVPSTIFSLPGMSTGFELSPQVLNNYALKLTLQQAVFTGFRLENSESAAQYNVQAAESDLAGDRIEQTFAITNGYWTLYKAREVKNLLSENVSLVKAHLQNIRSLAQNGAARQNDVLKVQVQLSDAEFRLLDAENNVRMAMVSLNNLLGLPLSTELDLSTQVGSPVNEIPVLDETMNLALAARPDVSSMEYRIKAGEAGVDAARASWYPQVYVMANYNFNRPNQRIFPTKDEFRDTWDVGVSVSFDVWNWRTTSYQTNQAQAQLAQAQDALGLVRDGIAVEVTQSWISLQQARERISVAKTGVEQAEENYRMINETYKLGDALNTDVMDAQTALLQAKTNYTTALVDYEIAWAKLRRAKGEK